MITKINRENSVSHIVLFSIVSKINPIELQIIENNHDFLKRRE